MPFFIFFIVVCITVTVMVLMFAGLLIKQMLELSEAGLYSAMQQKTCGLLMYSVPHRGLSLAALTSQVHYLLYPSTEVQELSTGKSSVIL